MINPSRVQAQIQNVPSYTATKPSPHVSSRYGFVQTPDIVGLLQEQGYQMRNVRGGSRGSSRELGMHEVRMIKADVHNFGRGDVFPEIVITNSHDRSSRAMLDLGFWRAACDNGLVVSVENNKNFQLTHLGDLKEQLTKAVGYLSEFAEMASDKIEAFQNRRMTGIESEEFITRAATLRGVRNTSDVGRAYRSEDSEDTLWLVYNRAQENLLKGRFKTKGVKNFKSGRPITSVRRSLNLNKDLWKLAEEFLPS